jgi:hypothetical protein
MGVQLFTLYPYPVLNLSFSVEAFLCLGSWAAPVHDP